MATGKMIITLEPMDVYFFGGEKNFDYGTVSGKQALAKPYYIESEKLPSQSTLFGLVRYLGIAEKTDDFRIDAAVIGAETFALEKENQEFGCIQEISGLYIEKEENGKSVYYMRVPLDHNSQCKGNYCPMTYKESIRTTKGEMLVPDEYEEKEGLAEGFMSVTNGTLLSEDDVFRSDVQTKIQKSDKDQAFFKKRYYTLNKGYRFAFELTVTEGFPEISDQIVYMGKEKSSFLLRVKRGAAIEVNECLFETVTGDAAAGYVKRVALSDCYFGEENLVNLAAMAYIKVKNHREFYTNYERREKGVSHYQRFHKNKVLYRLIEAGSVFIVKSEKLEEFEKKAALNNTHLKSAGYNRMNGGKK